MALLRCSMRSSVDMRGCTVASPVLSLVVSETKGVRVSEGALMWDDFARARLGNAQVEHTRGSTV